MTIIEIVDAVATRLGIEAATAEQAVGTILSIIQHEAPAADVQALLAKVPGAQDLVARYDVMTGGGSGGGLMGMVGSALGGMLGGKTGPLLAGLTQLEQTGLSTGQLEQTAQSLIQQVETAAGPELVGRVLQAVPGLKGHFGL